MSFSSLSRAARLAHCILLDFITLGWMIGGSSPGTGWEFFSLPPRTDRLWGPLTLLSNGKRRLFTRE